MRSLAWCLLPLVLPAGAESPQRVITVGGALTEIVYALDAQALLVGSDTTSYYPSEAEDLPKVGYQRALSAEGVLSLAPDLVIMSEEAGPPAVLEQLKIAGVNLLALKAGRSVDDVKANVRAVAKALDRERAGQDLIRRIDAENVQLAAVTERQAKPKRVMFILQHGGGAPMVAGTGTAADSIITLAGAVNVADDYGGYKPLTPEAAVALKPDVVLITIQGMENAGGKESLLKAPGLSLTPAAKRGSVIAMDSLLLLGFGPRTVEAAMELNQRIQGDASQ